ncbi:hypothetical protein KP509_21G082900 [Ceratopteris richardii]|nr:hypothetical protein KP509_21G082900 [Ceratopteris richardii]
MLTMTHSAVDGGHIEDMRRESARPEETVEYKYRKEARFDYWANKKGYEYAKTTNAKEEEYGKKKNNLHN